MEAIQEAIRDFHQPTALPVGHGASAPTKRSVAAYECLTQSALHPTSGDIWRNDVYDMLGL